MLSNPSHTLASSFRMNADPCWWHRLAWAWIVVLLASACPLAHAQTVTQQLSLSQGGNLVSLHVQPNDPSFDAVFGSDLDKIAMVKNEDGQVYLPGEDIEQITTWESDESYRIYAEEAFQFDISGTAVSPGSTPVRLETGGNFVPFLLSTSSAVEDALTSISETVVSVEDGQGNTYAPGQTSSGLDSLRAGQGYKVYVDRADTLRYPVTVNTLADARALTGLQAGQLINVRGYHEQEDGGGGVFEVTNSACETDGGTCFVFDEDVSTEQTETYQSADFRTERSLSHDNLVWGTVTFAIDDAGTYVDLVDTDDLHAHTTTSDALSGDWIDRKAGSFGGPDSPYLDAGRSYFGEPTGSSYDWRVRYKYATSDRRLERIGVTNSVNLAWWGAPKADPDNPRNARSEIAYAINKAASIFNTSDYDWGYVDIPGEYYYRYSVRLRDGVNLRGTSDQTFDPAGNGAPTHGKLTIMPGRALDHLKDGFSKKLRHIEAHKRELEVESDADKFGATSLELDGNFQNNLEPFEDPNNEYSNVGDRLQNRNQWNGLITSLTGFTPVDSAEIDGYFTDVYAHDYPGNGVTTATKVNWQNASNVRVGAAQRNHQFYFAGDNTEDWTVEGSAWDVIIRLGDETHTDLTIQNVQENPLGPITGKVWARVIGHDGAFPDSTSQAVINGFDFDLSGGNNVATKVFTNDASAGGTFDGTGGTTATGTIRTVPSQRTELFSPNSRRLNQNYTYKNITVINEGGGVTFANSTPRTRAIFENIVMKAASGVSGADSQDFYNVPWSAAYSQPGRSEIINLDVQQPRSGPMFIMRGSSQGDMPYDVFVQDFTVDNQVGELSESLLAHGAGNPEDQTNRATNLARFYFDNATFNIGDSGASHRYLVNTTLNEGFPARFRNSQTRDGLVSDETGSFTSDASDEGNDYVLIPTSLFSYARGTSTTLTSGPSGMSISGVEVANSDGTTRSFTNVFVKQTEPYLRVNLSDTIGTGETVSIDWTARVTPLSEYQTTGIFVSRYPSRQDRYQTSFTTGNGPWTLDLRGVAASMEDGSKIVYTASSGNTSIVTASVQSDDYTLELTEQSPGTATITVTGEISGTGSASSTFKVSIE